MNEKLSIEQILTGQKACLENAKSLVEEANYLYKNGYFARSFSLIILAFEELEKIFRFIESLFLDQTDNEGWKKFWKQFKSHPHKLHGFELINFFLESIDDFLTGNIKSEEDWKEELLTRPEWFQNMKLSGFYVDFSGGKFILPSDINFEEHCKKYLPIAENRLKYFESKVFRNVEDAKKFVDAWRKKGYPTNSEEALEHLKRITRQ